MAAARLKTCMIKKTARLSLRGLALEDVPAEFGWGVPPFEGMWHGLEQLDLSNNDLFKTDEVFAALATLGDHLKLLDLSGAVNEGEEHIRARHDSAQPHENARLWAELLPLEARACAQAVAGHAIAFGPSCQMSHAWVVANSAISISILHPPCNLSLGNSLVGEVPASGGDLIALEELVAFDNQFTGISADAAGNWTRLRRLDLNHNRIVALPLAASAWGELEALDLRANQLGALEDQSCGTWAKLEVAKLGSNKLAALPERALSAWTNLRALYATDNRIAELPLTLAACKRLEVLHLGVNQIKDLPSELFGEPPPPDPAVAAAAEEAAAAAAAADAEGPETDLSATAAVVPLELPFTGCFGALREVELYRNKVAQCPDDFGAGLPALEQLSLSGNALKALPMPGLGRCTRLVELHLANNAKLAKVPDDLTGLAKLKYLNLAGCAAVKALPPGLAAAWADLREIDIRSGAKKEKCKLSLDWTEASAERGFLIRGGIPPKKGKKGKK